MSDDPKSASVPEGAGHPGEPARSPTPTPLAGDFTAGLGLVWLSLLAVPVGALCAGVAYCLIQLIGLFTSLFFYGRFEIPDEIVTPAGTTLGWIAIFIPAIGGLIIGLLARFGSERIRGHGIPEALEAILIGRSRMQPKVAVLKPLASAISIGSGGPFGAEGPIIMTGGAFGSLIAQGFRMTAAERKTLLVSGAAGGMSATFGTPVAAVLLAVELLLFEWKPRSFVPVAIASVSAAVARPFLGLEASPLFAVPIHASAPEISATLSAIIIGVSAGALSLLLTLAVYRAEDAFDRLPIHWMWWPAIGGLVVGIGGLVAPRALGVGYDVIAEMLSGDYVARDLLVLMVVKCVIWAVALGSGTSGGVLAPLLIMGGVLGALEGTFLPGGDKAMWPLVSMAAIMGGTMRSPLTGVVFALELTYDIRLLLPLTTASVVAHAFTVLVMKRSILTEKVARRGYHVSREYSVDPLERLSVSEAMTSSVVTIPASMPLVTLIEKHFLGTSGEKHQGFPVVDDAGKLLGIVTKSSLLEDWFAISGPRGSGGVAIAPIIAYDLIGEAPITALPWESCRTAAERMAHAHVGRLVVVAPDDPRKICGILTRSDLLKARSRLLEEELTRERFLRAPMAKGLASSASDRRS